MPRLLARAVYAALFAGALLCGAAGAQQAQVPKQHRALHDALQARVSVLHAAIPRVPGAAAPLRGAALQALSCATPAELLDPGRRTQVQAEMDGLRRAGAQLVVLDVCHPLLTPAFHDVRPLLELLANVANDARLRELRLLVRHGSLPPERAVTQGRNHYRGMTQARLFEERAAEAKLLTIAVQPDYLTLVGDPQAQAGLRLQPPDWRRYVETTAARLRADLADLVPALGAGSSMDDSPAWVDSFADARNLDYVDLRFYRALHAQGVVLDRLIAWPRAIRARDPAKRLVLSEVWLAKAGADEPAPGPRVGNAAARASYAFWSALDAAFLDTVARAARAGGIELIAVSRPDLLFAYLDFYDPTLYRASAHHVLELAAQRAAQAREQGTLSAAGRAFGAL